MLTLVKLLLLLYKGSQNLTLLEDHSIDGLALLLHLVFHKFALRLLQFDLLTQALNLSAMGAVVLLGKFTAITTVRRASLRRLLIFFNTEVLRVSCFCLFTLNLILGRGSLKKKEILKSV